MATFTWVMGVLAARWWPPPLAPGDPCTMWWCSSAAAAAARRGGRPTRWGPPLRLSVVDTSSTRLSVLHALRLIVGGPWCTCAHMPAHVSTCQGHMLFSAASCACSGLQMHSQGDTL